MALRKKTTKASREERNQTKLRANDKSLSAELLEIGQRCAAHVKLPVKSSDRADMLYNNKGLPR